MVSVIIPTLNRLHLLSEVIKGLIRQDLDKRFWEVIIVDGGSTDGTAEYIASLRNKVGFRIKWIRQNRKFVTNARNCGIKSAEGKIVAFLDDDCVPRKDWLHEVIAAYERFKKAGAIGGSILPANNSQENKSTSQLSSFWSKTQLKVFWRRPLNKLGEVPFAGGLKVNVNKPIETEHLRGCHITCTREALEKVKLNEEFYFDEQFTFTCLGELLDLTLRIRNAGFKLIYNPRMVVYHLSHSLHLTDTLHGSLMYTFRKSSSLHENMTYAVLKWKKTHLANINLPKYVVYETCNLLSNIIKFWRRMKDLNGIACAIGIPIGMLKGLKRYLKCARLTM